MESNYEKYVAGLYDRKLNEKERLILRVTRMFGECDVAAPPDYIREVTRYIEEMAAHRPLRPRGEAGAGSRLSTEDYRQRFIATGPAAAVLLPGDAGERFRRLSEADRRRAWGIAKGMWQFIPETGRGTG